MQGANYKIWALHLFLIKPILIMPKPKIKNTIVAIRVGLLGKVLFSSKINISELIRNICFINPPYK